MSGFCGWVGFAGLETSQRDILEDMGAALTRTGKAGGPRWIGRGAALVSASIPADAISIQPDVVAVVAGSPYFADPELAAACESDGPAAALTRGYRRRGARVLKELRGAFALAVIRPESEDLLLAIDRIGGRRPLSFKLVDGGVIFATHGDALEAHPRGRSEIDPQGIYDYLYYHVVPAPRTARKNVRRLLPGHSLSRNSDGRPTIEPYWEPRYVENNATPLAELEREFLELLRDSVLRLSHGVGVGCFLSGGTDSSAVAGMLSETVEGTARTYSIGFAAEGYDEMEYAREAVRHFGTEHHEYYLEPDDVVALIPRIAESFSEPYGNESAVPTFHCARLASEGGVERILGGDGGDELFAGNKPYAKQKVFAAYQRIPAPLRALLEPIVFGFPAGESIPPVRKVRSYIRQASVPMPRRAQSYTYLERLGAATILDPDFLAGIDTNEPLALLTEAYDGAHAENMLNRMLAVSMRFTLADNDLPKVSRMCDLAGVDVAFPLLSDELVEFSCRLPEHLKLRGLKLRWFYKHALRDFLPDKILNKRKHGFGMPFGIWMRDHAPLRDIARTSLEELKSRRVVRADFIDRLIRLHGEDDTVYYGVLIWVLMQLEQWFKAHVDRKVGVS